MMFTWPYNGFYNNNHIKYIISQQWVGLAPHEALLTVIYKFAILALKDHLFQEWIQLYLISIYVFMFSLHANV